MKEENEDGEALKFVHKSTSLIITLYYKDIPRRQYNCEIHAVYIVVYSWR